MLDLYANQEIPWKKRLGVKDNGMSLFAPAVTVKGKFEYKRKLIRNDKGERVVSEAFVMTAAPVTIGDALHWDDRDWTVLKVSIIYDLMGAELHREVNLYDG